MKKLIAHINFAKGFRGGERQTLSLIQELSSQGYSQIFVGRVNSDLAIRLESIKNVKIIRLKKPYVLSLNQIKDAYILHAHESKAAQFCYFANLRYKIPYIITRRVDIRIKDNFFNKKIYLSAINVVVLSNAIKKRVEDLSSTIKIKIIPDSLYEYKIDSENINKLKDRFENKFIIGNIAALEESKGQQYIIKLAKQIEKTYPNIHFLLLGKGKDEDKFKEESKGLSNITFEGFVDNVGDYLSIFDIFLFPSLSEGFGSSILDAMSFKIPVIATRVGGIPDLIDNNKTGILIENKELNNLENVCINLYKNVKICKKLCLAAYSGISGYNILNIVAKYNKLYKIK